MKKNDWDKTMAWNIRAFMFLIFVFVLMAILQGCSHKTVETAVTDTLTTVRTDTVRTEKVVEKSVKEYIDRWNDRLVVVNPLGDTLKDVRKERVYVEKDTHLRDSVAVYKALLDSMRAARNHSTIKTVEVRPPLKQRIGEALMWMIIGAVIILVIIKKTEG